MLFDDSSTGVATLAAVHSSPLLSRKLEQTRNCQLDQRPICEVDRSNPTDRFSREKQAMFPPRGLPNPSTQRRKAFFTDNSHCVVKGEELCELVPDVRPCLGNLAHAHHYRSGHRFEISICCDDNFHLLFRLVTFSAHPSSLPSALAACFCVEPPLPCNRVLYLVGCIKPTAIITKVDHTPLNSAAFLFIRGCFVRITPPRIPRNRRSSYPILRFHPRHTVVAALLASLGSELTVSFVNGRGRREEGTD